jgi:FKBP-type peptidyl-prolyl cis-trans isomerase SlyD
MIGNGAKVKIHYRLSVEGRLIDSSEGREPLEYVQGAGQIVAGLESHLARLKPGDKTKVAVPPEQGYGAFNEEAIQKVPKEAFEDSGGLEVGRIIQGKTVEGQEFSATVKSVEGEEITLDLNHPLAGQTLFFEVEIVEATSSEDD